MRNVFKTFILIILITSLQSFAQEKFTLSGIIDDKVNNETLIGVNIIIPELQTGATTNEYGFFSITLPEGTYKAQISYLGYTTVEQTVVLDKNQTLNYSLEESTETLDDVVITKNVEKISLRKPQMSVNSLSIKTIKQMPVVLGEVDVIKSITLLPGVKNAV
jgi:hypothetical protein